MSAHPHVCGEHFFRSFWLADSGGSSPRVWGAQHSLQSQGRAGRLIPTCVGSTRSPSQPSPGTPAHPHVCGEHGGLAQNFFSLFGSSPRVWGAPSARSPERIHLRLIPTCVGSTGALFIGEIRNPAHPHVCGEHFKPGQSCTRARGSSPRVWGAPVADNQRRERVRLIPTCVGSTIFLKENQVLPAAHPHVCGEHTLIFPLAYG